MKLEIKQNDGLTYVILEGSITSQNALEFEKDVNNLPSDGNGIIIDANKLTFISSAGLRVILSLKKKNKNKVFKIIGVNQSVMNIFEVTGFAEIMDIEMALRHIDIQGLTRIGAGSCGECFRLDDETIVKLYYGRVGKDTIDAEKALAKKAFVLGIPTAISYDIVESEGRIGVVYELLNCKTLCEVIKDDFANLDKYVEMYANVCKLIHSIDVKDDNDIPSFLEVNKKDILRIYDISDKERDYLYRFLEMAPKGTTCIHGDLNINNIMVQNGECCLIDMGEFSKGTYLFDISRIIFSMRYVNDNEYNDFYKMPQKDVTTILELFLKKYFGKDSIEEVIKEHPEVEWLEPLAWFRCATSMLKKGSWAESKRDKTLKIFREKLIPFIEKKIQENQ